MNKFNHVVSEIMESAGDMHIITKKYVEAKHKLNKAKTSFEMKAHKTVMKEVI